MKKKPFTPDAELIKKMVLALRAAKQGLIGYSNCGRMEQRDMTSDGYCKPLHVVCDVLNEYVLAERAAKENS